jgi:hypothetical protein
MSINNAKIITVIGLKLYLIIVNILLKMRLRRRRWRWRYADFKVLSVCRL